MAKGGRRYARDARGRFASTGATAKGARVGGKAGGKTRLSKGKVPATEQAAANNKAAISTTGPKGTIGKKRDTRVKQRAQRMVAAGDSYASVVPRASQSIKNSARSVRAAKTKATNKARVGRAKANVDRAMAGGLDRKNMRSMNTAQKALKFYKGKK